MGIIVAFSSEITVYLQVLHRNMANLASITIKTLLSLFMNISAVHENGMENGKNPSKLRKFSQKVYGNFECNFDTK